MENKSQVKQVGLLTDFYVYDEAYSLCGVVSEQLEMLRGMNPILVVDEAFPKAGTPWHEFEMRRISGVPRSNTLVIDKTWDKDVATLKKDLEEALADVDVCISHDMIFQPSMGKMHAAARQVASERPDLRWLNWIHSATGSFMKQHAKIAGLTGPFPNSKIVFPNEYDILRVAVNYEVDEMDVVHVPHSTNPLSFIMVHPLSRKLAKDIDLLDADVIGCYPARLDAGKQVEVGLEIFHGIKLTGREVRYVVFDFHSTGKEKKAYRNRLKKKCQQLDLAVGREVVFLSEWSKETEVRSPRQMVRDIMLVGDVLVLPSRSESYSLIAQEAALCRNLLVLNSDFLAMYSIYGHDAIYGKFSSNMDRASGMDGTTTTKYSNRQEYMNGIANRVIAHLEASKVLKQFRWRRKYRNPYAVFRDYLEPLLWRES